MSQENVELTRELVRAWNRRDVAGFVSRLAPDIEMLPTGGVAVHTPMFCGRDEVAAWFTESLEIFDVLKLSESEIRDDSNATVWLGRLRQRAAVSGVDLDLAWAMHGVWAKGKAARINTFRSWPEALKAVGLEE